MFELPPHHGRTANRPAEDRFLDQGDETELITFQVQPPLPVHAQPDDPFGVVGPHAVTNSDAEGVIVGLPTVVTTAAGALASLACAAVS